MALIPEDRKTEGLMLPMSVRDNLSFATLDRLSRGGIRALASHRQRPRSAESAARVGGIEEMIKLLADPHCNGTDIPVGALSGGNQQKVVIAKWLMRGPRIILLNDPTRGIDVGTKQEMYQLLRTLANAGDAIVFYSTDLRRTDRLLRPGSGALRRRREAGNSWATRSPSMRWSLAR